jgi:Hydroxymethylglutaryl-coenzyme A synthase N terminal
MVGLEALAFSVPQYYINLTDLAVARGIDPGKYTVGLGQREMSIATPCEDAVTLAAGAGRRLLSNFDIDPESMLTEWPILTIQRFATRISGASRDRSYTRARVTISGST